MSDRQEALIMAVIEAQNSAARNYISKDTSFVVGKPDGHPTPRACGK